MARWPKGNTHLGHRARTSHTLPPACKELAPRGVEGKQQKKSKNYTKNALRVADNAMIEGACIHREARR